MLAMLQIKMKWTKESRTPNGAIQRQKYYHPVMIEEDVALSGNGVFLKICDYYQEREYVHSGQAIFEAIERQYKDANRNVPFAGQNEHNEKLAWQRTQSAQRDRGAFYNLTELTKTDIPGIRIAEEADCRYRVKWFDCERGMPRRRGGNEDLYQPGARLAGRPNILNETAFILREGESGMLKYNYRLSCHNGQWYECYYVYIVNTDTLTRDVFMRTYDYEYDQLADLF